MLARNPKLFHLVLIAACSVAVAVILTIWHINGIAGPPGRDILIGVYRKLKNIILLATIDVNFSNKTKNKSQEISFHDHSYDMEKITISVSDEINHGSIVSDSHTEYKQNVEEIKSLNQIRDNGKNVSIDDKYF